MIKTYKVKLLKQELPSVQFVQNNAAIVIKRSLRSFCPNCWDVQVAALSCCTGDYVPINSKIIPKKLWTPSI